MITNFFEHSNISEVLDIKRLLDGKKRKLMERDFSNAYAELDQSKDLIKSVIRIAKDADDELLANSAFIVYEYLALFCNMAQYFYLLQTGQYKSSWNILQNCFDVAKTVGRFVDTGNRYEVPEVVSLLISYELLYPYNLFASSEMLIIKSHCSICNNPMLSLDCHHIKGNLYWGEMACEVVDDGKFSAVAIVKHPLDKRCVMETSDDKRSEEEKFEVLDDFVHRVPNRLSLFDIKEQKSIRRNQDIIVVGRNDLCSCGSGKKFKNCCSKELYYQHTHLIICPKEPVSLQMVPIPIQ